MQEEAADLMAGLVFAGAQPSRPAAAWERYFSAH
jgi:hypothetical protein